jgi:hypothetical protein
MFISDIRPGNLYFKNVLTIFGKLVPLYFINFRLCRGITVPFLSLGLWSPDFRLVALGGWDVDPDPEGPGSGSGASLMPASLLRAWRR